MRGYSRTFADHTVFEGQFGRAAARATKETDALTRAISHSPIFYSSRGACCYENCYESPRIPRLQPVSSDNSRL